MPQGDIIFSTMPKKKEEEAEEEEEERKKYSVKSDLSHWTLVDVFLVQVNLELQKKRRVIRK